MYYIHNVDLFTGEELIRGGCVVTDGKRIACACKDSPEIALRYPRATRVDGGGGLLIPGLVNAHTHAAMSPLRGIGSDLALMDWLNVTGGYEARYTPDMVYWGTLLAAAEMLRHGITAFADMYFHLDAAAQAAVNSGMRVNLSRGSSDMGGVNSHLPVFEKWNGAGDGRVKIWMGIHAVYTSSPQIVSHAIQTARDMGVGVHTHISESLSETRGCAEQYGVSPVRYFADLGLFSLPVIAAHCVHVSPEDIALLRGPAVFVAHNPSSNLKLANGIAPITDMMNAGVNVCIGTDGAASNNTLDVLRETRLASLLAKGATGDPTALSAPAALSMATRAGARALGFNECGLLKPGMRADLAILSADDINLWPGHDPVANAVYAACGQNVIYTMVNGVPLYENGRLTAIDVDDVKRHVMALLRN